MDIQWEPAQFMYGYLDVTDDNYKEKLLVHETLHGLDDHVWSFYHLAKQNKPFNLKGNIGLFISEALKD